MLAKHASNCKKIIRNIESASRNIINADADVLFYDQYIQNNLLPGIMTAIAGNVHRALCSLN